MLWIIKNCVRLGYDNCFSQIFFSSACVLSQAAMGLQVHLCPVLCQRTYIIYSAFSLINFVRLQQLSLPIGQTSL